jgi:predicted HicB family RNase H-like nuclease
MPANSRQGDRHLVPQFNVRVPDKYRKELKHLAIDRGLTLNALLFEAVQDLLVKYRRQAK